MTDILLLVQVALMVLIVIFVLLQKSSSMGLGGYSGSNESLFGAKGPANFLVKGTVVLGVLFVLNTLSLGYIYNQNNSTSVLDTTSTIPLSQEQTANEAPKAPSN